MVNPAASIVSLTLAPIAVKSALILPNPVNKTRRHTNCPYENKNKLTVLARFKRGVAKQSEAIGWHGGVVAEPAGDVRVHDAEPLAQVERHAVAPRRLFVADESLGARGEHDDACEQKPKHGVILIARSTTEIKINLPAHACPLHPFCGAVMTTSMPSAFMSTQ